MNYQRLVPANSFMGRYLSYMQNQETAPAYDWWTGLFCVSAACARRTYVDRPRAPVFLNLFVILVGESGIPRKSSAIAIAKMLVRSVIDTDAAIWHIDAKVTPEKLDATLHTRTMEHGTAQLCITVPELAVFMGTERYIAAMPVLLTDLYDCPSIREGGGTIERGGVMQRNVWVAFLSGSTPVWLLKTVNPNVVEGGFTSRCYFIVANKPKRRIPWPDRLDYTLWQDMKEDLQILRTEAERKGPITLTPEALAVYTQWYENRTHSLDPFKQSFEAREDAHVLRVAALLSINDGTWCIGRAHVRIAARLIAGVKDSGGALFENAEARTKFAVALDLVRTMLISAGMDPVPRHKLFQRVRGHLVAEDFNTLMDVLHECKAIQRFELEHDSGKGRRGEWIRGTQLLLAKRLGETVLERFI